MTFSIIIATYNRAKELVDTLQGLTRLKTASDWEVIVADNNSKDATRQVVESAQASFPVPLRYVFEATQGKAAALNTAAMAPAASGEGRARPRSNRRPIGSPGAPYSNRRAVASIKDRPHQIRPKARLRTEMATPAWRTGVGPKRTSTR